jgi:spore germination protein YaaH
MRRLRRFPPSVIIALLVAATAGLQPAPALSASAGPGDPAIGPHAADEARHAGIALQFTPSAGRPIPPRASHPSGAAVAGSDATSAVGGGRLRREVFGFAPYWEMNAGGNWKYWNYSLLSTVGYFGLTVNNDGSFNQTDAGWAGWNSQQLTTVITSAHLAGDRVVLVIKAFGAAGVNAIVTDTTGQAQRQTIANTIAAIQSKKLDGVNVDFEGTSTGYPNVQQGMTSFMTELAQQVHQQVPGSMVSMDTYSGSASWDGGIFKIGDLAPVVDYMFVMNYDQVPDFNHAGPNAPLNGWTYNATTSVSQYLAKAPASKVVLGVPYYGYKWCTVDSSAYSAATTVNGDRLCPNGTKNPVSQTYAGALTDFSCAQQLVRQWDDTAKEPWASWYSPPSADSCGANHGSYREMYYDDPSSLGYKYDLVNAQNLRGAGAWALGYDGSSPDLWNEIALKFVSQWESLAGSIAAGPDVASWGAGRLDVFARGFNATLVHTYYDASGWHAWESLGGRFNSDPSIASWGTGRLDVFARGSDWALWHRWFSNGSWSAWESLGGNLNSSPDAASWGVGRLDVFARGNDQTLMHKWYDAAGWHAWESLGGQLTSDPGAVSWSQNRLDVFARGVGGTLIHRYYNGTGWSAWEGLGSGLYGGPDAVSWGPGRLDVFARFPDNTLRHKWYDGSGWSYWEPWGGRDYSDPGGASWATGRLDAFVRGPDNSLWHLAATLS